MKLNPYRTLLALAVVATLAGALHCKKPAHQAPEPKSESGTPAKRVFFIEPADGAVIKGVVKVKMGVEGMVVKPAGAIVEGTGHHHILVNRDSLDEGTTIPADSTHIHYGKGQTEAELKLKPGKYKLTLQFADGSHASYGPALSATISVTVQ